MKKNAQQHSGYVAVVLLIFVVAATVIATAALGMTMANLASVSTYEEGAEAMTVAQSGAENAVLRLLRDPSYTGETLVIGSGTATVTASSTASTSAITSVGVMGSKKRKVQVNLTRISGVLTVTSWAEVYN